MIYWKLLEVTLIHINTSMCFKDKIRSVVRASNNKQENEEKYAKIYL